MKTRRHPTVPDRNSIISVRESPRNMEEYTLGYTGRQLLKRCCLLGFGLFVMSLGIAMSKIAGIGTTPISCIPATLTFFTPLSMGTLTFLFNTLLIGIEVVVLGKRFRRVQLLQVFMGLVIGVLTDVSLALLSSINPNGYAEQWFWCIMSCLILGLGVLLEVRANVLVAPGEGIVVAFVTRFKIPFPRMKILSDCTMVTVAAVLSLIFTGGLNGVREGTVFAAATLGLVIGFYRRIIGNRIDRFVK